MEKDELEDSRTTEQGNLLLEFKVNGYGLMAYPPSCRGDPPDPVECNGNASIELDEAQAIKLRDILNHFLSGGKLR